MRGVYMTDCRQDSKGNSVEYHIRTFFDQSYFVVDKSTNKFQDGKWVNLSTETETFDIDDIAQVTMIGDYFVGDGAPHYKLRITTKRHNIQCVPFADPENLLDMYGMLTRIMNGGNRE